MYGGVGGNNTNGRGSAWKLLFVGDLELSRENPGSREGAGCKAGNNGALVESFTCFFLCTEKPILKMLSFLQLTPQEGQTESP